MKCQVNGVVAGCLLALLLWGNSAAAQPPLTPPPLFDPSDRQPTLEPAEPEAPPMAEPRLPQEGRFAIDLRDMSRVRGTLIEPEELKFTSELGEITIALGKISGFRENPDSIDPQSVTLILRNGDTLTGKVELKTLEVKTLFGDVEIDAKHVMGITATRENADFAWQWNSGRWRLHHNSDPYRSHEGVIYSTPSAYPSSSYAVPVMPASPAPPSAYPPTSPRYSPPSVGPPPSGLSSEVASDARLPATAPIELPPVYPSGPPPAPIPDPNASPRY